MKIEVWGERALFTRPELKAERVSYDVITPSAAIGIIEAIYWHPGIRYKIKQITVLNEIQHRSIFRNEVTEKANVKKIMAYAAEPSGNTPAIYTSDCISQRRTLYLSNVHYIIDFSFDLTQSAIADGITAGKVLGILDYRLSKGRYFEQPYLGVKEFPANVRMFDGFLYNGEEPKSFYTGSCIDFGQMVKSISYSSEPRVPFLYHAVMRDGIITVEE